MKMKLIRIYISLSLLVCICISSISQTLTGLSTNPVLLENRTGQSKSAKSVTAISDNFIDLPFFDDFADYHFGEHIPRESLWRDKSVFINNTFGDSVFSLGVATLDAIDAFGNIYASIESPTSYSDTLTSQYIRTRSATDSVFLTFFYQGGGKGEAPEIGDSLIVDFYHSDSNRWYNVWSIEGSAMTTFDSAFIFVADSFRTDSFQFRFRNITSLVETSKGPGALSNVDFWNIDYIKVNSKEPDQSLWIMDDLMVVKPFSEIAYNGFSSIPQLLLNRNNSNKAWNETFYHSFRTSFTPVSGSKLSVSMTMMQLKGLSFEVADTINEERNFGGIGGDLNIPEVEFIEHLDSLPYSTSDKWDNFSIDRGSDTTRYIIRWSYEVAGAGDDEPLAQLTTSNDTFFTTYTFADYYAYDDGIPEYGYGLTGESVYQAYTALKFEALHSNLDTLTAIDIYFNKTRDVIYNDEDLSPPEITLMVWSNDPKSTVEKPDSVLYEGATTVYPVFTEGEYGYQRFLLSRPVLVPKGFYIGFRQETADYINIGYDVNNPQRNRIFVNFNNNWFSPGSDLDKNGSLMMRPIFNSSLVPWPADQKNASNTSLNIYPNPTPKGSPELFIKLKDWNEEDDFRVEIVGLLGNKIYTDKMWDKEQSINITGIQSGLYIVRVLINGKHLTQSKVLVN